MEKTKGIIAGGHYLVSDVEPEAIFCPEDFTDEHKMIAKTARQFVEKEVQPHREAIEDQDFERVVALLRQAGSLGLLAHSVPEQYGGLGLDKISKILVGEIVGGGDEWLWGGPVEPYLYCYIANHLFWHKGAKGKIPSETSIRRIFRSLLLNRTFGRI